MEKEENKKEKIEQKIPDTAINTLKKNSAEALKGKQGMFIKMAILGEKKKEAEKAEIEKTEKRKLFIMIGTFLFIFLGLFSIFFSFFIKKQKANIQTKTEIAPIKFGTLYQTIDISNFSKKEIIKSIHTQENIPSGLVKTISLIENQNQITTKRFLELIGARPSQKIIEELFSNKITINLYDTEKKPFLLIRTISATQTLLEMENWENSIQQELYDLFHYDEEYSNGKEGVFSDLYIENQLVRIAKDTEGKTVLLYTVLNNNTLVITANEEIIPPIIEWIYKPTIRE